MEGSVGPPQELREPMSLTVAELRSADPRLDRRIPRLYGLLLSIAVLGVVAVPLGLLVLVRLGTG